MSTRLKPIVWSRLDEAGRDSALTRPDLSQNPEIARICADLVMQVRQRGDAALRELTERFDGVRLDAFRVDAAEARRAQGEIGRDAVRAINTAIENVRQFHAAQETAPVRVETTAGVVCERVTRPLQAVGLYVPAGSAPLPSTAIMLAVPAALAGCPIRIICTPPRSDGRADPSVVVAAQAAGVTEIYRLGGAQAVAAMAYGTESVPKVEKIFGPGNAWVTAAKAIVAADPAGAALDLPAGPSEVMVIADADADPRFVALDLLSQAEHGPDSQVILVTTDARLVDAVDIEIEHALPALPRREIIARALEHSRAIIVGDEQAAIDVANRYAPEHLILQTDQPRRHVEHIRTAGSVFIGPWTPEAVGDYCSGTNHVLPTYGYARTFSGLSLGDFQRRMTLQELSEDGLRNLADTVTTLAALEGLDAHAQAVRVRLDPASRGSGR